MSEIDVQNLGFKVVHDTVIDSGVLSGLVEAGVIPKSFRVIKGEVDLTGLDDGEAAAVVDESGNQITLSPGSHLVYISVVETTTLVSGGSATVALGLAPTAAVTATAAIADTIVEATAYNGFQSFADAAVAYNASSVGAANVYLEADVAVATISGGVLSVVLVVV
jgi:hypothetical protein